MHFWKTWNHVLKSKVVSYLSTISSVNTLFCIEVYWLNALKLGEDLSVLCQPENLTVAKILPITWSEVSIKNSVWLIRLVKNC